MNTIHLQASVAGVRGDYDYLEDKYWNEKFNSNITEKDRDELYIIIRVYPECYFKGGHPMRIVQLGTPLVLLVIEITIEELIGKLIFDKRNIRSKEIDPIQNIFGCFTDKDKTGVNIASNCLFEFRNGLNMPNISTLFKISNIDISGGTISNRSALKATELNLSWFLIKLYAKSSKNELNKHFLYPFGNSKSISVLSTKVNRKIYDNIKFEEFKEKYTIPFTKKPELDEFEIESYDDEEFKQKITNYILRNANYTWEILIKEMSMHIPVIIKNIEKKIQEKTSHIEKISIERKEGRSNYGKTKIKYKNNELASQSKQIEKQIEIEKLEIEELKNKLNDFKSILSDKKSWSKWDLDSLQKIHNIIIRSRFVGSDIAKPKKVWARKKKKK
jgi:hypothetical protein